MAAEKTNKNNENGPSFLSQHWFLLALAVILPTGVLAAEPLSVLNHYSWPRTVIVCVVMGLMALPIPFELIRQSIARPWPALLASIINMVVVPLLAWMCAAALPAYLGGGLIVAAAIPCTLASAAVWTRRAGGDDTVAILVTLITNLTCVIVTPLWLVALLGRSIDLQVGPLVKELVLVVLIPIAVAQILRTKRQVASWAQRRKAHLAMACQLGILFMVLVGAIEMGLRFDSHSSAAINGHTEPVTSSTTPAVTVLQIIWTVLLAAAVHLVAMAIGWQAAGKTGVPRPQQIGVAISGSQKTLMIGLKLAMDCGVSILPMVAFHVGQLLLDTFIADRWRASTAARDAPRQPVLLSPSPPTPFPEAGRREI